jgi:hypothetical protein
MIRTIVLLCAVTLLFLDAARAAEPRSESGKSRVGNLPLPVPLEEMPASTRDTLSKVMKSPTVTATCPPEEFVAHSDVYTWLLDNPDRTAAAWRKLGVEAIEIKTSKDGRFCWKDENGSELTWQSVAQGPSGRVWYAEGKVKPGPFLPTFPVKAVAILNHAAKARPTGDSLIKHQVQIFLHSDSRAANFLTRMFGDAVPKMAEQGSEQLLMFFSGIAKYAHDKPEKAKALLSEKDR